MVNEAFGVSHKEHVQGFFICLIKMHASDIKYSEFDDQISMLIIIKN